MVERSTGQTLRAGAFFIAAIALFAGAALWVAGSDWVHGASTVYQVDLDDAGELAVGDEVYIAGVVVGSVDGIGVSLNASKPVTLRIELPSVMELRADSTAKVVLLDLLGSMGLDVNPGSPDAAPLRAGGRISGLASTGPQELLSKADQLATRLTALMKQAAPILAATSGRLPATIDNVAALSASAASVAKRVDGLATKMERAVPRVLKRADRASVQTLSLMKKAHAVVSSAQRLTTTLDNALGKDGEHLQSLVGQARTALGATDAAAATVADNRATIDVTLASLSQAAANLEAFSQQISEQPYSLIRVLPTEDRVPGEPMGAAAP